MAVCCAAALPSAVGCIAKGADRLHSGLLLPRRRLVPGIEPSVQCLILSLPCAIAIAQDQQPNTIVVQDKNKPTARSTLQCATTRHNAVDQIISRRIFPKERTRLSEK